MATNLALDDQLIEEARLLGGHRTKSKKRNSFKYWTASAASNLILRTTRMRSDTSREATHLLSKR